MGQLIKTARQQRRMSQMELASCLNVSRQTVIAIEKGNPQVGVGIVFEAAYMVGIPLLSDDQKMVNQWQAVLAGFTALLPNKIHTKKIEIDDDF